MASAVYLASAVHSALEWANDCRAEGWPEATAGVHLNEGLKGREVHWGKDFWDCWSCWSREGISGGPFYPNKEAHTLRTFAWQLPASHAHRYKTGCDAVICSDAEICLITVTIMIIWDIAFLKNNPGPALTEPQWIQHHSADMEESVLMAASFIFTFSITRLNVCWE